MILLDEHVKLNVGRNWAYIKILERGPSITVVNNYSDTGSID